MNLHEILQFTNKATDGPWVSYIEGRDHTSGSSFIMTGNIDNRDYDIESGNLREEDQDFIAMSRTVVPELIGEILRLRKLLDDNAILY